MTDDFFSAEAATKAPTVFKLQKWWSLSRCDKLCLQRRRFVAWLGFDARKSVRRRRVQRPKVPATLANQVAARPCPPLESGLQIVGW
jgi:hypothetical protein